MNSAGNLMWNGWSIEAKWRCYWGSGVGDQHLKNRGQEVAYIPTNKNWVTGRTTVLPITSFGMGYIKLDIFKFLIDWADCIKTYIRVVTALRSNLKKAIWTYQQLSWWVNQWHFHWMQMVYFWLACTYLYLFQMWTMAIIEACVLNLWWNVYLLWLLFELLITIFCSNWANQQCVLGSPIFSKGFGSHYLPTFSHFQSLYCVTHCSWFGYCEQ